MYYQNSKQLMFTALDQVNNAIKWAKNHPASYGSSLIEELRNQRREIISAINNLSTPGIFINN